MGVIGQTLKSGLASATASRPPTPPRGGMAGVAASAAQAAAARPMPPLLSDLAAHGPHGQQLATSLWGEIQKHYQQNPAGFANAPGPWGQMFSSGFGAAADAPAAAADPTLGSGSGTAAPLAPAAMAGQAAMELGSGSGGQAAPLPGSATMGAGAPLLSGEGAARPQPVRDATGAMGQAAMGQVGPDAQAAPPQMALGEDPETMNHQQYRQWRGSPQFQRR